jgi:hypothetical protein
MHDGNRGDHTKTGLIAGIIVAALIAVAFISWGLWKAAEYEREASDQAREYAAYTDEKIRKACLSLPPVYQKDCATEARHEQRGNERNEHDLVAQRKSALWAYIMGAAAVIGMGLSVIGVFLVWTTFDATRKANAIANDALDGQLRPWISIGIDYYGLTFKEGVLSANLKLYVKNRGTSPALYVTYTAAVYIEKMHGERVFNLMPTFFEEDGATHHNKTIFPGDEWDKECFIENENFPVGPQPLMLVIAVRYRSPYSTKHRYTCKIYDLNQWNRADGLIDVHPDKDLHTQSNLREDMGYIAT